LSGGRARAGPRVGCDRGDTVNHFAGFHGVTEAGGADATVERPAFVVAEFVLGVDCAVRESLVFRCGIDA
jgi:hypothetical protein